MTQLFQQIDSRKNSLLSEWFEIYKYEQFSRNCPETGIIWSTECQSKNSKWKNNFFSWKKSVWHESAINGHYQVIRRLIIKNQIRGPPTTFKLKPYLTARSDKQKIQRKQQKTLLPRLRLAKYFVRAKQNEFAFHDAVSSSKLSPFHESYEIGLHVQICWYNSALVANKTTGLIEFKFVTLAVVADATANTFRCVKPILKFRIVHHKVCFSISCIL